ncbi:MAG: response regulator [Alphaproteobacteria bacterium]|nr:response regulator [Alphaproteobacteria bacterium]
MEPIAGTSQRPRLLAVDDAAASAELIARIADRSGFSACYVSDPTTVVTVIRSWHPAIIVTDICMPQMDAIELWNSLRLLEFTGELMLVSGQNETLRQQAGKLAGIKGLKVVANMQKPLNIRMFGEILKSRLSHVWAS